MQLELTLMRGERYIREYWSQYHRPIRLSDFTLAFNKACMTYHGFPAEELASRLTEANRVHMFMSPKGARYYLPKAAWDRLNEYERVGVVNSVSRKKA